MSQATADLLIEAGKSGWIKPREEKVFAKGKGEMQTYWVTIEKRTSSVVKSDEDNNSDNGSDENGAAGTKTPVLSSANMKQIFCKKDVENLSCTMYIHIST